jgi:hypothetical protein
MAVGMAALTAKITRRSLKAVAPISVGGRLKYPRFVGVFDLTQGIYA